MAPALTTQEVLGFECCWTGGLPSSVAAVATLPSSALCHGHSGSLLSLSCAVLSSAQAWREPARVHRKPQRCGATSWFPARARSQPGRSSTASRWAEAVSVGGTASFIPRGLDSSVRRIPLAFCSCVLVSSCSSSSWPLFSILSPPGPPGIGSPAFLFPLPSHWRSSFVIHGNVSAHSWPAARSPGTEIGL